jgi:hypothetical protein
MTILVAFSAFGGVGFVRSLAALASGPIPTFALIRSGHFANVGITGPLTNMDSSEAWI